MAINYEVDWAKISPDGENIGDQVVIFGHGARSSARKFFGSGKVLSRPLRANIKFYCPPNKILTDMFPGDINNKVAYYTAKRRKIHEYYVSNAVHPDMLQEDADQIGYDIYTPVQGKNDLNLRDLFQSASFLAGRYRTIHCVFCRVGLTKRNRARLETAYKETLKYKAKAR